MEERRNRIRKPRDVGKYSDSGRNSGSSSRGTVKRSIAEDTQARPRSRAAEMRAKRLGETEPTPAVVEQLHPQKSLSEKWKDRFAERKAAAQLKKAEKGAKRRQNRDEAVIKSGYDFTMLFIIICLLGFGVMMLYSVTSYSDMMAGKNFWQSSVFKQLILMGIGLFFMTAVSLIPVHFWDRFVIIFYVGSLILCQVALRVGHSSHGSSRWLTILGVSVQPAEMLKISLIMLLALMITNYGSKLKKWYNGALLVALIGATAASIMGSNLSSALIIGAVGMLVLYAGTENHKIYRILFGLGIIAILLVHKYPNILSVILKPYQMTRIYTWLNPFAYKEDEGYQTVQSMYAIASGGFTGKGLGQSIQKLSALPEAQNDFIFGVICEELGIFGATILIVLYLLLIWRMIIIAHYAKDSYGFLITAGATAHIGIQVAFNIGVATGILPNTGIGLPFVSSGGSAVLILLIEMGLVLSVSRESEIIVDD